MESEIRSHDMWLLPAHVPEENESIQVFSVTITDKDNNVSKFVVKLGRSKFGYPELTMITRAKRNGKKRVRSLQSIPINPEHWDKKKKKKKNKKELATS